MVAFSMTLKITTDKAGAAMTAHLNRNEESLPQRRAAGLPAVARTARAERTPSPSTPARSGAAASRRHGTGGCRTSEFMTEAWFNL